MSRLVDRLVVCLCLAVITAPAIAMIGGWRDARLGGVIAPVEKPGFHWKAFRKEEYQHAYTAWFERYLGYRGFSVHVDSSALYHVFGEAKPGAGVYIGADKMLFQVDDVGYFNRRASDVLAADKIAAFADKIASVQRRLAARGQALVPIIVPSKTSIYPEKVPAGWRREVGSPRPSDLQYQAFRRAFDQRGIRYADMRARAATMTEPRELFWLDQARHWSMYASCLASRAIVEEYAVLTRSPSFEYPCLMVMQVAPPRSVEFDLQTTINAWGMPTSQVAVPYVVGLAPAAMTTRPKPDVLLIGTSFMWNTLYDVYRSGAFDELFAFYYNRTQVAWPSDKSQPVAPDTDDWRRIVDGSELIVLDLFEPYIDPDGYAGEVLDQLSAALDRRDRADAEAAAGAPAAPAAPAPAAAPSGAR